MNICWRLWDILNTLGTFKELETAFAKSHYPDIYCRYTWVPVKSVGDYFVTICNKNSRSDSGGSRRSDNSRKSRMSLPNLYPVDFVSKSKTVFTSQGRAGTDDKAKRGENTGGFFVGSSSFSSRVAIAKNYVASPSSSSLFVSFAPPQHRSDDDQ